MLDPMTFIYKLEPYRLKTSRIPKKWTFYSTSRLSKIIVLHADRQTYRQTDATEKHYHTASTAIIIYFSRVRSQSIRSFSENNRMLA